WTCRARLKTSRAAPTARASRGSRRWHGLSGLRAKRERSTQRSEKRHRAGVSWGRANFFGSGGVRRGESELTRACGLRSITLCRGDQSLRERQACLGERERVPVGVRL